MIGSVYSINLHKDKIMLTILIKDWKCRGFQTYNSREVDILTCGHTEIDAIENLKRKICKEK